MLNTPAGSLNLNAGATNELLPGCHLFNLTRFEDQRGVLLESFRMDHPLLDRHLVQLGYVSTTRALQVRGPHEHRYQSDYFIFAGPGHFAVFLWENRPQHIRSHQRAEAREPDARILVGDRHPTGLLIPPGVVHAYRSLEDGAMAFNIPNFLYRGYQRQAPADEVRYEGSNRFLIPDDDLNFLDSVLGKNNSIQPLDKP